MEAFEARIQKMSAKELAGELAARKLKTGKSIATVNLIHDDRCSILL